MSSLLSCRPLDGLIVYPEGHRYTGIWEDAKNRIVDLHCFEYTGEGEILYEGDNFPVETFSGKGKIEEIEVSCIEPYSQVMFHLGYEFDENDVHDVKLLCETFHIEIPNEYR